jgi:VanZ family protein
VNPQRLARAAFALGALVIVYLSLVPTEELPKIELWDKLEHALAYAVVAVAAGIGWAGQRRAKALIGIALMLLGVLLEFLQSFVPGRLTDPGDALANLTGIVLGLGVVSAVARVSGRVGQLGKGW